jgi:hypothetical protein
MDMTTLENPHSTETSVMVDGKANFDLCTALLRRLFLSSGFNLRLMAYPLLN